jgi:hypothetical protein
MKKLVLPICGKQIELYPKVEGWRLSTSLHGTSKSTGAAAINLIARGGR